MTYLTWSDEDTPRSREMKKLDLNLKWEFKEICLLAIPTTGFEPVSPRQRGTSSDGFRFTLGRVKAM